VGANSISSARTTSSAVVPATNQTGGTLRVHNGSTLYLTGANSSSSVYNLNGGTLEIGGNSLKAGYGGTVNPYQFNIGGGTIKVIESALVTSVNATLTGGVSTIDTNGLGATWSGVLSGAGGLAKVGAGTLKLSGLNTYSGVTNITAGTLQTGAASTFSSASAFTVGTGANLDLNGFNQTIGSLAGSGTVTNNGASAATLTAGGDNTTTTFSGALKDGPSAALGFVKTGSGFLTLTGTNTYTGRTTINGTGFLLLGDGNTTAKIVGTVTNNAFFEIVSADTSGITTITNNGSTTYDTGTSASSAAITSGGGSLLSFTGTSTAANATITTNAGAKTQFLGNSTGGNAQFVTNASGIVDFSGTTGPAGNHQISAGSIAGTGSYYLGANQLTVGGNGLNTAVSGVISDCGATGIECNASGATGGSLVKVGVGALTLSGVNTYSGVTAINGGTLAVSNDNNLGAASGGLSLDGGTLQWLVGFNSARTVTLTVSGTFDTNGFTATLAGPIGGNGSLTKAGNGTLILAGSSTYTGATIVNGGTLLGLNPNSFAAASAFTVAAGATLDLAGADEKIGSLAGAGVVTTTNGIAKLTTGGNNASTTFSGVLQDGGGANIFALDKTGTGTFTLSGINTYTGATTVNAGTLSVTGDISSSSGVTANAGGTLNGTGLVKNITINNGGTLAPGLPSAPGTLTATGSLVMQAAATYLVQVSLASASKAAVTGAATLGGTLGINATGGGYTFGTRYAVLSAAGGFGGTAFANTTATSGPVTATVSYDAHDVFITLSQAFISMPVSASGNAKGVANALNAYIADPPLPPAFQNLFNLSPAQLAEALAQLSGENNAGGGQQASFQMMNEFLLLMLNPFDSDRGGFGGAGFGAGDGVSRFAPDRERALPPEIARAYAALTPPSERATPFSSRWNVWASAFGGTNNTNGDPNGTGSHNFNARTGGVAAGVDYKLTPDTLIGFALAGGGTSWGLSQGLGGGSTDAFQAGLYGSQKFGPWYVSGAVAFANYWASTTRTITLPAIDTLNAGFNAQSWGGRAEAGYRIAWSPVNLAPYVALQAQSFSTPNYTETATSGFNVFALSYASHTASVVRSELGSWLSNSYLVANNTLVTAFGRAAWAHDWEDTPQATATFVGLAPIASFIVNGGKPAADLALVTAGAEIRMAGGWALMGKFDGEFGEGTQTYVGTARARYAW
jgi:autotransporter-associated beta strand protein